MSDPTPPASLASKAVLTIGSLIFFHAAYSTYEFFGLQKSLGIVGRSIPTDIKVETVASLLVILLGTVLTASPLRDITWASEYRKRTIDQIDARPSFMTLNHRGPIMFESND